MMKKAKILPANYNDMHQYIMIFTSHYNLFYTTELEKQYKFNYLPDKSNNKVYITYKGIELEVGFWTYSNINSKYYVYLKYTYNSLYFTLDRQYNRVFFNIKETDLYTRNEATKYIKF